jgi:hypothetical protein
MCGPWRILKIISHFRLQMLPGAAERLELAGAGADLPNDGSFARQGYCRRSYLRFPCCASIHHVWFCGSANRTCKPCCGWDTERAQLCIWYWHAGAVKRVVLGVGTQAPPLTAAMASAWAAFVEKFAEETAWELANKTWHGAWSSLPSCLLPSFIIGPPRSAWVHTNLGGESAPNTRAPPGGQIPPRDDTPVVHTGDVCGSCQLLIPSPLKCPRLR